MGFSVILHYFSEYLPVVGSETSGSKIIGKFVCSPLLLETHGTPTPFGWQCVGWRGCSTCLRLLLAACLHCSEDLRPRGGQRGVFKEKVESDDENKAVTLNRFQGDEYKVFKPVCHVVPNPKGRGSIAKQSIEYEKLHEGVPPPDKYLKLMINISKDLDVHFGKA